MIKFESAIQSTLTRLNDEYSHTEFDPYTFHPSQIEKCPASDPTQNSASLTTPTRLTPFKREPPSPTALLFVLGLWRSGRAGITNGVLAPLGWDRTDIVQELAETRDAGLDRYQPTS